ncbi:459_t:CDS:2, partial [Funneliformis mosseae]
TNIPTAGIPEVVLQEVRYRETWDSYFQENVQEATRQSSHNALSTDLEILKSGTKARWKALAMQRDLTCTVCATPLTAGVGEEEFLVSTTHAPVFATPLTAGVGEEECLKRNSLSNNLPIFDDDIEDEDSSIEKLTFEPHIAKLLLPYRRVLEEMRNHHIEEELQRARNLSLMLKWSVVDHSLFKRPKFCPNLSRPAVNMNLLKSVLMETQNRNLRHAVIIVYNLIAKEIVDNVNSEIRQWLARLFGVHKNEHCVIDVQTALTAITS